ncbi:class I SAM-dependent methyltransferase [Halanaerobaculum tunisiense]
MNTIDYYNRNAIDFYENTVDLDMSDQYQAFLRYVKENGHILDAGCGSGRDSLYFLEQGYQITAVDASQELVKLSSELINQEVLQIRFQEMEFEEEIEDVFRKFT